MSAQPAARLTPEEYLEIERSTAEIRSEYYDGQMFAMSGGTYSHSLTISNLVGLFRSALAGRCTVVSAHLRVRAAAGRFYTYPDLAVICGEPRFADDQKDTLINPILIVEVLSPSTEASDRGFKFAQYRQIESLQEYALVSPSHPRIEVFRRGAEGDWIFHEFAGLDAVCHFTSVDCKVRLAEVYQNVPIEP